MADDRRRGRHGFVAFFAVFAAASAGAQTSRPASAAAAVPDAVIERWVQDWTLAKDGSIVYHEKKAVRINHERAVGEFADPRITFNRDTQSLDVITARTRLPDGRVIELPAYGRTEVSPGGMAGWPVLSGLRQVVLVMSGVEPGCVVETEYRLTTQAAAHAELAADLLLQSRYPIHMREIRIDLPRGFWLTPVLAGVTEQQTPYVFQQDSDGGSSHLLAAPELPTIVDEPQSPDVRTRAARFTFSTAAKPDEWLSHKLEQIAALADESELATRLAREWTKDVAERDRPRVIQEKLAATFNFVDADRSLALPAPRAAGEVLRSGYGTQVEAAAVLLSLFRAAGLKSAALLVLADGTWVPRAPQDALVAAYGVALGDGASGYWHAQHGRIARGSRWNGCTIVSERGDELVRENWQAWNDADQSLCDLTLNLTLTEHAKISGSASVRLTGLFVSADALRTPEAQSARCHDLLRRVIPGVDVMGVTVRTLADGEFAAEVKVKLDKPLEEAAGALRLVLAADGPASADVALPLAHATRTTPLRLAGAFDERVTVSLTLPAGWTVAAYPSDVVAAADEWGAVAISGEKTESGIKFGRWARIASRELTAKQWLAARTSLNELRSERMRTVLIRR